MSLVVDVWSGVQEWEVKNTERLANEQSGPKVDSAVCLCRRSVLALPVLTMPWPALAFGAEAPCAKPSLASVCSCACLCGDAHTGKKNTHWAHTSTTHCRVIVWWPYPHRSLSFSVKQRPKSVNKTMHSLPPPLCLPTAFCCVSEKLK